MSAAICIFHKVVYCWDDDAPTLLVPCSQSYPTGLSLPVCLCDQGRLTGPGNCLCSYSDSKCESACLGQGGACGQQQQRLGEISDYLKVLLGLVTFLFIVSFYVAVKRYMQRRCRQREADLGTGGNMIHTISGNHVYHHRHFSLNCHGNRWLNTARSEPPSYDEVNSMPPPYELAVKRAAVHHENNGNAVVDMSSGCHENNDGCSACNVVVTKNLATHLTVD